MSNNGWPLAPLSEIAIPVQRSVPVDPGKSYRTLGVKWWGEGAYERQTIDGSQTAATTLNEVCENDLIVNKIWVRHGSVAVVTPDVAGCCGSNEFPTFEFRGDRILPRWMHWYSTGQRPRESKPCSRRSSIARSRGRSKMAKHYSKTFGEMLREKRLEKGFSLRKFAQLVGVSPTYLSQVEQGNVDPPTADRVKRMAELLGENADELIALAGRVPEDLPEIIHEQSIAVPDLLRAVRGLTADQLGRLREDAQRMHKEGKGNEK